MFDLVPSRSLENLLLSFCHYDEPRRVKEAETTIELTALGKNRIYRGVGLTIWNRDQVRIGIAFPTSQALERRLILWDE